MVHNCGWPYKVSSFTTDLRDHICGCQRTGSVAELIGRAATTSKILTEADLLQVCQAPIQFWHTPLPLCDTGATKLIHTEQHDLANYCSYALMYSNTITKLYSNTITKPRVSQATAECFNQSHTF